MVVVVVILENFILILLRTTIGKLDHKLQLWWAGVRALDTGILLRGGMIDLSYKRL